MKVDVVKAKEYLGDKPLTKGQISMIRKVLGSSMATFMVERQTGERLSKKDKENILLYLAQEERKIQ